MSSKYDFVKIKVQLQEENYFILSRFLLSKMLLFCQVPPSVAVRVSLDVKKHFVDAGEHQISENQLRQQLFATLNAHGCGDSYITLYQRISEFQTARVPILVFIAGTGCCGKSSIAHMLGSKLSNFHIVNTNLLLDTLYAITIVDKCCPPHRAAASADESDDDIPFPSCEYPFSANSADEFEDSQRPGNTSETSDDVAAASHLGFWVRHALRRRRSFRRDPATCQLLHDQSDDENVVREWKNACSLVASSVQGEIRKALREGKALIIEGTFINLADYAAYIMPRALEDTMAELRGEQRGGMPFAKTPARSRGRPIVLSSLMQLPREVPPMVLRLWLQEQQHQHPQLPLPAASPTQAPLTSMAIDTSGIASLDVDSEILTPPGDFSASIAAAADQLVVGSEGSVAAVVPCSATPPMCDDEYDPLTISRDVEELLRVVEAAHLAEIESVAPAGGSGERLSAYVSKEQFNVRTTVNVGANLHEELLRRICDELDRQQAAAA
jgi:hypothetical protein